MPVWGSSGSAPRPPLSERNNAIRTLVGALSASTLRPGQLCEGDDDAVDNRRGVEESARTLS